MPKLRNEIPFNRASFTGRELNYIVEAVENIHISGDGEFTKKCSELLETRLGTPKILITTSCTHALELAALLLEIEPGDEVIVPPFTFPSTVNAFVLRGATPVFVDIRPDTLNLDEKQIEERITKKTKCIAPVHYAGVGCEMDAICEIARRYGLHVVEDNAHGLFGAYRDRPLGSFGALATLSFHETKNITCGEGGALLINDRRFIERAEIIREKGTDRARFFRGEVDKYSWVDLGSSYLPSDLLAAFLFAQLESADRIQAKRRRVWDYYWESLSDWARANGVGLPVVPAHCQQAYHMFYLVCPTGQKRDRLIEHLKSREILSIFHYLPLHLSAMGRKWGYDVGDFPVAEATSERLVRLPFYNDLEQADQERVCRALFEVSNSW